MAHDSSRYKAWTWRYPLMLHWLLNPGLAFNELVLGQRVPRLTLVEKDATKALAARMVVPCPHCGTQHDGAKWSAGQPTGYQNWFGLYCDHCGKIIPCLLNLTSLLLLALTAPVWLWFRPALRRRWLLRQPARYRNLRLPETASAYDGHGWVKEGISWGFFMFLCMEVLLPLLYRDAIMVRSLAISAAVWTAGGLGFGLMMKFINRRSRPRTAERS